jgi:hypothetical protein
MFSVLEIHSAGEAARDNSFLEFRLTSHCSYVETHAGHTTGEALMRVRVREIGKAIHPSEVVVEIQTAHGGERLAVDRESIQGNSLSIGWPIAKKKAQYLVELPRETMSGTWRVWVKQTQILPDKESKGAA